MKERGMIFNAEMVNAILSGRKTQTRRVMKVQPESNHYGLLRITDSTKRSDIGKYHWAESNATGVHARSKLFSCPFGQVGDRLWVRETFCPVNDDAEQWVDYRSTPRYAQSHPAGWDCEPKDPEALKWKPSIHMPRWASRITLEITGVRVERLHAITLGDICKEMGCGLYDFRPATHGFQVWEDLWQSIYGAESWQANSWVWVVEFKRVEDKS